MNTSSRRAKVLREQLLEYVEVVPEGRLERDGFGLNDAVAMLVVLERMFFDRGVVKLEDAYCPRERETTELITRRGRMEVVSTSMLIYGFEAECAARTDWRRPVTARKGAEAVGDGSPGGGRRGALEPEDAAETRKGRRKRRRWSWVRMGWA